MRALILAVCLLPAALAAAAQQPATSPAPKTSKGKTMPITYQATSRQPRWIAGARIVLDLRLDNRSDRPFLTPDPAYGNSPQPVFEVEPPQGKPVTVRPNANAGEWFQERKVTLLEIGPGKTWEGDFPLCDFADLTRPGHYRVRSWIEHESGRIESAATSFEIAAATVIQVAAETSHSDDGLNVVECVQLLQGGDVASTIVQEIDPRNAELLPLHRLERGASERDATSVLAPYSNFAVGLSELRWILTERNGSVTVGHNLATKRVPLFEGDRPGLLFPPVATQAGLFVAAVRRTEVQLVRVTGAADRVAVEPVGTVASLDAVPAGGAATLSPVSAGSQILLAMVWRMDAGTRVRILTVGADGKPKGQYEHRVEGWRPTGAVAVGWSTRDELRASFTARAMADPDELRCLEFRLRPDLEGSAGPSRSEPLTFKSPVAEVHLAYFETAPGRLSRMVVVRSEAGETWVIPGDEPPRKPRSEVPARGPLALLPGRLVWYAAWPGETSLNVNPL